MKSTEFNVPQIKASVIDLAAKVVSLKTERRQKKREGAFKGEGGVGAHQHIAGRLYRRRSCARIWQLAYAFARGVPYARVEHPKTHTKPYAVMIAECLADAYGMPLEGLLRDADGHVAAFYFGHTGRARATLDNLARRVDLWLKDRGSAAVRSESGAGVETAEFPAAGVGVPAPASSGPAPA